MDWQRVDRAIQLRDSGRVTEAILELESLLDANLDKNEKASILLTEVTCYLMIGRLADAELLLQRAKAARPDNPEVQLNEQFQEACVLLAQRRYNEGLHSLDRLLRDYPRISEDPTKRFLWEDIQQRRAFALVDVGRPSEALLLLKEAISRVNTPEDEQVVRLYLGTCFYELKEYELAKEQFVQLIHGRISNRMEAEARYRIAAINFREGALAQAKMRLEEVISVLHTECFPSSHAKGIYELFSKVSRCLGN